MADLESEFFDEMHKRVIKSFLDVLILIGLGKHSMSGYGIIAFIQDKFHMLMSSGTVYHNLYLLERKGLIKSEQAEKGRVYTLTRQGKENTRLFLNSKDKILGLILNLFDSE